MRAHRRVALERLILSERERRVVALLQEGPATDRELAERLGLGLATVRRVRQRLVQGGAVEAVPAPEGAHYPIAGWRLVGGGS